MNKGETQGSKGQSKRRKSIDRSLGFCCEISYLNYNMNKIATLAIAGAALLGGPSCSSDDGREISERADAGRAVEGQVGGIAALSLQQTRRVISALELDRTLSGLYDEYDRPKFPEDISAFLEQTALLMEHAGTLDTLGGLSREEYISIALLMEAAITFAEKNFVDDNFSGAIESRNAKLLSYSDFYYEQAEKM